MSDVPRYGDPGFTLPPGAKAPQTPAPAQEMPAPTLTVPKYGDPEFNLPSTARPTDRLRSFDPEIFREALRQSDAPSEDAAKIAASIQMATRLDMDPGVVYDNFDAVAEKYLGSKAVPMSVLQSLGSSWASGNWTAERNKLGAELMRRTRSGGDVSEILSRIEAHEANRPPMDLTPRSLPMSALKWALESTAGFYEPMIYSAIAGVVLGPGGLAMTGLPESTVAAARIASLGRFAAGYASTYESMAGGEMLELYNLKDNDGNRIQPRAAVAGAAVYGLLGGLSEYSQMAALLPGGSTMLGTIIKKVAGRLFGSGNKVAALAAQTGARAVGGYLGDVTSEAAEEAIQQSLQIGIEEFLKEAANQAGASFDLKPIEQKINEVAQAFGQAWAASTIMVAPKAIAETHARVRQAKQAAAQQMKQERIDALAAMADPARPPEERAAAIDIRMEELTKAQQELAPQVTLTGVTEISEDLGKQIQEFRANENELAALKLLKREEEAANIDAPWRKTIPEVRGRGLFGMEVRSLATGELIERPRAPDMTTLGPGSDIRDIVRELSPKMTDQEVDGVGLLVSALAYAQDLSVDDFMSKHFVPQVAQLVDLPGKRGATFLLEGGRSLIGITARSDFSTWAHELFHVVFRNLPAERTGPMARWAGALKEDGTVAWDETSQEKLTQAWIKYLHEGIAPTPQLTTLFERMAAWLVKAWEVISGKWQIDDDIRRWMDSLLTKPESGVAKAVEQQAQPTKVEVEAPPASAEEDVLFQTEPGVDALFEEAVEAFGVTDDIRKAGYILPDGRMLDFSDDALRRVNRPGSLVGALSRRGWRPQDHLRNVDHKMIGPAMRAIMMAGAIRVDGEYGYIELAKQPTYHQELIIREIVEANPDYITVQLMDDYVHGDPSHMFVSVKSFTSAASAEKLIGAIRKMFRTGEIPPPGRVLFQSEAPEAAEIAAAIDDAIARIRKVQSGDQEAGYAREIAAPLERLIPVLQNITDRGLMFSDPKEPEWRHIVHRSTKPEDGVGKWRVTYLHNGMPTGHNVGTLVELIKDEVFDDHVVVEAKGQPILPEAARGRTVVRPDILYQPDSIWYLRSQRAIETKMAGPMPGRQILKMLQNAGIKEDELKWTGLSTYLDTDERRSPQAVLEQIKTEAIVLDEVRKSGDWQGLGEQTKFNHWTMPGGQNYQELLLRLPYERPITDTADMRREVIPGHEQALADLQQQIRAIHEAISRAAPNNRHDLIDRRDSLESELDQHTRPVPPPPIPAARTIGPYEGPHWEESNVLVHARFDVRLDSDGREVLFIEEIQSDWHQQGREKGYRGELPDPEVKVEPAQEDSGYSAEGQWRVTIGNYSSTWYANTAEEAVRMAKEGWQRNTMLSGVPDAPFRKTWHELMFRRMLRWAAEHDFDVLAWTTGEQQAERYDLSKMVREIIYWFNDPTGKIDFNPKPDEIGVSIYSTEGEAIKEQEVLKQADLPGLVGKELAQRMLNREGQKRETGEYRLSEEGLKIGGEGMKGFYDKILVDYAKKYGKQWAAKVGEIDIGKSTGMNQRFQGLVHSIDISPSMRESVLQGQALFQPDPDAHLEEIRQAIVKGMPVPDQVLDQYRDDPVVAAEIMKRPILIDQARRSKSVEEFALWMMRAMAATPATEAYYKMLFEQAQRRPEDPDAAGERFLSVLDDRTLKDLFAEIQFVEGDNQESELIKALTPEMRELGKSQSSALLQKVRDQIAADPQHWRSVLKDNLPQGELQQTAARLTNAEVDADAPSEFRPVTARQANSAFVKLLEQENQLETFLGDLYHEENMGARAKSKQGGQNLEPIMRIAAHKAQRGTLDMATRKAAVRAIRSNATFWREQYAIRNQNEEMIAQLKWEEEHRDEAEDIRLRRENSRLRTELKKVRAESQTEIDLSNRKVADLQALLVEKDALSATAARNVQKARDELHAAEEKLSEREKEIVRAELGQAPDADAPPLIKAYRRRLERLEQQLTFQRQAHQQAMIARANAERAEKLTLYVFKPVDAGIADAEARQIETIQASLEHAPEDVDAGLLSRIKEWRRQNPTAPMPSDLVQEIGARRVREMTLAELEEIAEEIHLLRSNGRHKRDEYLAAKRQEIQDQRDKLTLALNGGTPPEPITGLGTVEARQEVKTPKWKQVYWGTLRMNRIAVMLDGGKPGPFTHWLWDRMNDATDAMETSVHKILAAQEAKLKELGIAPNMLGKSEQYPGRAFTHAEMIGVYIYQQFEKGLFSLQTDNNIHISVIKQIVADLSKEEKAYADWMIDVLSSNEHFDRMQSAELDFHNQRMVREDRYFPFQRRDLGNNAFMSEIAQYLLEMRGLQPRRGLPGFLKRRLDRHPGQVFPPLRLDAPVVFNDYVQKSEWFIANADLIKSLNRLFHPQMGGKQVRNAVLAKYGDKMAELLDKHVGAYENPNIYRAIDDWGGLARLMRTNVSLSMLGFNLMTILRQLPDIPQIMVQAGPLDAITAAARILANPKDALEFFYEKAPQFRARSYDRFTEELKLLDRTAYERTMSKIGSAGFAALQALDVTANVIGWTAIYTKTLRETGNDITATKTARDFLLTHRPAARAKDLAQFYRQPGLASWLLMFTNQQNQQWNIGVFDLPRLVKSGLSGNTRDMMQAVREATAFMIAAVGMALVARKRLPEPEEYPRDILAWISGNVPFVGNDIENAVRGQGNFRGAIQPIGGAYDIAKAVTGLAEGESMETATRSAMNALWELSRTTGLPVVQGKRIIRTIESGDPWELLGGPPKAAGE